ncbi:MAG: hypothetical protein ACRDGI_05745 [Candidatus Limnocylindrales bacterium]
MTRRHFEALADALAMTRPNAADAVSDVESATAYGAWCAVVIAISDVCAASNGAFDRGRFQYAIQTRADRLAGIR